MNIDAFLEKLTTVPESIEFEDTMAVIERFYDYTPAMFNNGELVNEAGQNSGSCKLFAFAQQQGLSQEQTLNCFGRYYREEVLKYPKAEDHQNIRNFIRTGWEGIHFESSPLQLKSSS